MVNIQKIKFAFKSTIVLGALFFASSNRFVASEEDLGGTGEDGGSAIVGGAPATTNDFFVEGHAMLLDEEGKQCGSAQLIAPDLLLSAAHVRIASACRIDPRVMIDTKVANKQNLMLSSALPVSLAISVIYLDLSPLAGY